MIEGIANRFHLHVRWCGTPFSKSPDTSRPRSSTASCTSSVSAIQLVSASTASSLCCAPKAACTAARANGAPGRGRYFHGARRPSGISLSKPVRGVTAKGGSVGGGGIVWGRFDSCQHFVITDAGVYGGRGIWGALVSHMGTIAGGRGVSISIRPLSG